MKPIFVFRPWLSFLIIGALVAIIIIILPKLQTGFLPAMDEGSIVLDYSSPPGTNLEETDAELREVEKIIVSIPEVQAYSRRTGTQMGFFITEPNRGDYLIQLKSKRKRTTEKVIEDIRQKVSSTQPALRIDFGQVINDMLGHENVTTTEIYLHLDPDHLRKTLEAFHPAWKENNLPVSNSLVQAETNLKAAINHVRILHLSLRDNVIAN